MVSTPTTQIYGLDITDAIGYDSIEPNGPSPKISDFPSSSFPYPSSSYGGISNSLYKFNLLTGVALSIDELKEIISEVNNAPEGGELFPFDADHSVYIQKASSTRMKPKTAFVSGVPQNIFESTLTVYTTDNYLYGPNQILYSGLYTTLPQISTMTNAGTEPSGPDYIVLSGYKDTSTNRYTSGVSIGIDDYSLTVIDKMAQNDLLIVDRFGHITHKYETDFGLLYSELQKDFHGSDYVNYGTSGTIAHEAFYMYSDAKLLFPSYGPLLAFSTPFVELEVSALTGTPTISYAFIDDLSDIEEVSTEIELGYNKIYLPDCQGKGTMFIGVTTDDSSTITLESFNAEVMRDVSREEMPSIDPGESGTFTIDENDWSSGAVNRMEVHYRDVFSG